MTAAGALEAIRALHNWTTEGYPAVAVCEEDGEVFPCRTLVALDASEDAAVVAALLWVLHEERSHFLRGYRCRECGKAPCRTSSLLLQITD